MNERPTLNQVAQLANVHHTTVSRALRNDPRIPLATRERILEIAKKIGYSPDPMLSALASYRNAHAPSRYRATLAWITNHPTRDGWKAYEREAYYRGAKRRAAELGYTIEDFWLREPGMTEDRANKILLSRNIHGLLFIPQPRSRVHLSLDWSKFSAITFGHTLARPTFHNVENDHFRSFALLMRQLKKRGYRKPGFASWRRIHESTDRTWTAAFSAYQTAPPQRQIPIFMNQPWTFLEFKKWFLRYKPDVVISHDLTILTWIREMKLNIPCDVGFALAARHGEAPEYCSGIDENNERVGRVAVDVVAHMINQGEYGIPSIPISTLIEGTWIEGSTLRKSSVSGLSINQ